MRTYKNPKIGIGIPSEKIKIVFKKSKIVTIQRLCNTCIKVYLHKSIH